MSLLRITPLAALIAAISLPTPAADSSLGASPAQAKDLPSVQVTATAPAVQLNVPGTATVITREQMDRRLVTNIRSLVQYEPGVSVIGAAGRFGLDSFNIRGLSGNRTRIELDGVPMPASFGAEVGGGSFRAGRNFIDLDNIRQVDIVRGPASALYPSDSLGGVVSLQTKDPADYLHPGRPVYVSLKEQYASVDRSMSSTLTLAGGDARNGLLFVANHQEGHDTGNQGDVGGVGSTRTRPDPQTYQRDGVLGKYVHTADSGRIDRITLDGSQQRTRTSGLSSVALPKTHYYNSQDASTRTRASFSQWFPRLESLLADTLDWNLYWQKSRTRTNTQTDTVVRGAPIARFYNNLPLQEKVFGGKLVAVKRIGDGDAFNQSISYGVEVSRTSAQSSVDGYGVNGLTGATGSSSAFLPSNYPLHLIPGSQTRRYSVFAQDEFSWFDGVITVVPGVRADRYEYRPGNDVLYLAYNPGFVRANDTMSRVSPKLGVIWRLDEAFATYANIDHGFRPPLYSEIAGSWNEQPVPGVNIAFLPSVNLKAETSRGVELGLRGKGDAGWFNVAGYFNKYRNFIWSGYPLARSQVPAWALQMSPGAFANQFFRSVNTDRAFIKGAEASGVLRLGHFTPALVGWSLKGSAAVTTGRLVEPGNNGYTPLNTVDPAKLVVGIGYDRESWGAELVGTGVRRHTRLSDSAIFRPSGYGLLDFYAHYSPVDNLTLYAGVNNITDRKYWDWGNLNSGAMGNLVTGSGLNDAGTGGLPADRLTMPGRSASVAVRLSF
jgi:hemoglobin/transferrin/lactoferrin receptor protein